MCNSPLLRCGYFTEVQYIDGNAYSAVLVLYLAPGSLAVLERWLHYFDGQQCFSTCNECYLGPERMAV